MKWTTLAALVLLVPSVSSSYSDTIAVEWGGSQHVEFVDPASRFGASGPSYIQIEESATSLAVAGTPADGLLFCGTSSSLVTVAWVVGVPSPMDCDQDGSLDVFITLKAAPVAQGILSCNSTPIHQPPGEVTRQFFGCTYLWHGIGIRGALGRSHELSGLIQNTAGANARRISIVIPTSLEEREAAFYTRGSVPFATDTVHVIADDFVPQPQASFVVENGWDSWYITANLPPSTHVEYSAKLMDSREMRVILTGVGREVGVGVTTYRTTRPTFDIEADFPTSSFYGRIQGYVTRQGDTAGEPSTFFDIVGLPSENYLRYRPGFTGDCSSDASLDLIGDEIDPWDDSATYRALSLRKVGCGNRVLEISGSYVHRIRAGGGDSDPQDPDGNKWVMLGGTVYQSPLSRVSLSSTTSSWLPNYSAQLKYRSATSADYSVSPALYCSGFCDGTLSVGGEHEEDALSPNTYFWSISKSQADDATQDIGTCMSPKYNGAQCT